MTQRISFDRSRTYDPLYERKPSLQVQDSGPAICRWCGQRWDSIHRLQYSPCCYTPRVKHGEVALMRLPRNPRARPVKRDRFFTAGKFYEVKIIDAGGVMLNDGRYLTWAQWPFWVHWAKVVQRGDA